MSRKCALQFYQSHQHGISTPSTRTPLDYWVKHFVKNSMDSILDSSDTMIWIKMTDWLSIRLFSGWVNTNVCCNERKHVCTLTIERRLSVNQSGTQKDLVFQGSKSREQGRDYGSHFTILHSMINIDTCIDSCNPLYLTILAKPNRSTKRTSTQIIDMSNLVYAKLSFVIVTEGVFRKRDAKDGWCWFIWSPSTHFQRGELLRDVSLVSRWIKSSHSN